MNAGTTLKDTIYIVGMDHGYSDVYAVTTLPETPSITVSAQSGGKAKISWNSINGAAGYQIWRSTTSIGTYTLVKSITDGQTLSYSNSGLTVGTKYYYKIRAYTEVNGKKTFGAYSNLVNVTAK